MTAHDLIHSIYSRPAWGGVAGNVRRISPEQLVYLRDLIDADSEGAAVHSAGPGSIVWKPSGREKYIITEDLIGDRHTIERVSNLASSECGLLFR